MNTLPVVTDCWNQIGVRGDHSCPELPRVVHCHNCSVFASAGRRFLNAPSPDGYLEEWTRRLAAPIEITSSDLTGVLIFRLAEEWLALSVLVLVEVTLPRPIHRIPHRGGILAGLVNIRGELHLCARLDQILGVDRSEVACSISRTGRSLERLLVLHREDERWVVAVDEVDQVYRVALNELVEVPPTISRALVRLSRGVFHWQGKSIGLLDDERLFQTLRGRLR